MKGFFEVARDRLLHFLSHERREYRRRRWRERDWLGDFRSQIPDLLGHFTASQVAQLRIMPLDIYWTSSPAQRTRRPSRVMQKFNRSSPAAARTIASNSGRSASFCIRVTTLPRISTTLKSGRIASSCALRRLLLVAIVAPGRKSLIERIDPQPFQIDVGYEEFLLALKALRFCQQYAVLGNQ